MCVPHILTCLHVCCGRVGVARWCLVWPRRVLPGQDAPNASMAFPQLWPGISCRSGSGVSEFDKARREARLVADEECRHWHRLICEQAWLPGPPCFAEDPPFSPHALERPAQRWRVDALEQICGCSWACIEAAWDLTAWLIRDRWACSAWAAPCITVSCGTFGHGHMPWELRNNCKRAGLGSILVAPQAKLRMPGGLWEARV